MPQMQLPFFPDGVEHINAQLAFEKRDGQVIYFNGNMPVFIHAEDDVATFRMITAQFCINGNATQAEISRAFGVTLISVKRAVKRYRDEGVAGFYQAPKRRGPAVLTAEALKKAQSLLDEGLETTAVAGQLGIKRDTLAKAILAGRLHKPIKKDTDTPPSTKSERSREDAQAPLGVGASNVMDRVAASVGELTAVEPVFQGASDLPNGGVLLALPALLAVGLLHQAEKYFKLPKGYYGLASVFLLLAFLALARLPSLEQLRYRAPGEWGKLLGLDRIPEVRTLRKKLALLSDQEQVNAWSAELCARWMGEDPEKASVLYVDGHVRVYHGSQTKLPRHYVARQKLCLRATTDYWVNAMDGQPFFLLNQAVDPGLLQVLEQQIVPRLEETVPNQPTPEALAANSNLHRFTLIFDREGYSPAFMRRMKEQRIACVTYHKYPGTDWPQDEFQTVQVELASGARVLMQLAERGTFLGGELWVREIRKLTTSGHQSAIIATDYHTDSVPIAAAMFARWSQENFFRYMRQHYGLDRLVDYGVDDIPDTIQVVNPEHRRLDGLVRSNNGKLSRRRAAFAALTLKGEIEPKKMAAFELEKAELQEQIDTLSKEIEELKAQRKAVPRHITIAELPEEARFKQLSTQSKQLIDTIKMVAYRAETAMVQTAREVMHRADDARSLLRALYATEADLVPDEEAGTLTVRVHHQASHCNDEVIRQLCNELNETETIFPGTSLRLVYELVSNTLIAIPSCSCEMACE
jgi:prepilin-type processing-associated H-X9-DG protein